MAYLTREDLCEAAAALFGVTPDPRECGYILPDGRMLDLSGRHVDGSYVRKGAVNVARRGADHHAGQRLIDHRELAELTEHGGSEGMLLFMSRSGAVRVMPGMGFSFLESPTPRQLAVMCVAAGRYRCEVNLDVDDIEGHSRGSGTFAPLTMEAAVRFCRHHFPSMAEAVLDVAEEIPGLASAPCPLTWADDNLERIGNGDTSSVYAHPGRAGVVVRVSGYPDGWLAYAGSMGKERAEGTPMGLAAATHAPRALAYAHAGDGEGEAFIAFAERLSPIGDEETLNRVALAVRLARMPFPPCMAPDDPAAMSRHADAMAGHAVASGTATREEVRDLVESQPLILEFLQGLEARCTDLKPENWMMRGPHLVLNDPIRGMGYGEEERFRREHRVEPASAPRRGT